MSAILCLFLFILLLHFIGLSSSFRVADGGGNINLNYLGTVDGKSFFAQMLPGLPWEEVGTFCSQSGMQIAAITSIRQRDLLASARNNETFQGMFWTSGRDAKSTSQFVWHNNETPSSTIVDDIYHLEPVTT